MTKGKKTFDNIVVKGENAFNTGRRRNSYAGSRLAHTPDKDSHARSRQVCQPKRGMQEQDS